MSYPNRDEIDHAIVHALLADARNNTNAEVGERVSVSASTVGKRVARLEDSRIIKVHRFEVDYDRAGFPLRVPCICTAPIAEREALIKQTLELTGVINVRELMTGQENVHIQVVGATNDDITRIAQALDSMGYTVTDEILMRARYNQPSIRFHEDTSIGR